MQRKLEFKQRSEEEEIKESGLNIDFDEIAKKGKMSKEEGLIAKWFGIYGSRQPGTHMARVVIPGGEMTSSQVRVVARVAELYAQGRVSLTTRQCVQLHMLKTPSLADMIRGLAEDGLTTFHGCGDVNRNVVACPLAQTCRYRRINVLPYAKEISRDLAGMRDLDNLPRKFKIALSGCGAGCAQPFINCIGINAVQRKGADGNDETGFRVIIGGGQGWEAFLGQEILSFVPKNKISAVCRAVALLFRDHGDRRDRTRARLKFVMHNYGPEKCRELTLEYLKEEGIDTSGMDTEQFEETGVAFPDRPLTEEDPVGTDGKTIVRAIIPKGEIDHHRFKRMAELTEIFGNKRLYVTNRQNLEIHGVLSERVAEVKAEIEKLGYETNGSFGITDIVPCVGTTYCPKAVSRTRDMYDVLQPLVRQEKYDSISKSVTINITGCPNSCSPFRIADIGLRGLRIREEIGSVEGYEIRVGGQHDKFGKIMGEYKTQDSIKAIENILDKFLEIREGDETLSDCAARTGLTA